MSNAEKIKEIIDWAKAEADQDFTKLTGKTITDIADDLGINNPSKATLTKLGIVFKNLGLKSKRSATQRLLFCEDWQALYSSLGLDHWRISDTLATSTTEEVK